MKKEIREAVCDEALHLEAYRFEGLVQPFPNHFHEYYVIGYIEEGERALSCRNQTYTVRKGDLLLFGQATATPAPKAGGTALSYRSLNLSEAVMLELAESRPQDFSVRCQSPELLRFTLEGSSLRLFTVATLSDPLHSGAQASDSLGRIVWISDSGAVPLGLSLPPKHFFAARQPDGSHRFYGSYGRYILGKQANGIVLG